MQWIENWEKMDAPAEISTVKMRVSPMGTGMSETAVVLVEEEGGSPRPCCPPSSSILQRERHSTKQFPRHPQARQASEYDPPSTALPS